MPEVIHPESDHEFPTPTDVEVGTAVPLDKDGQVIITDVEFPMPKIVTQRYDGTTTEPGVEPAVKTVDAADVDKKVVKTSSGK
jgi:hypothetical protein